MGAASWSRLSMMGSFRSETCRVLMAEHLGCARPSYQRVIASARGTVGAPVPVCRHPQRGGGDGGGFGAQDAWAERDATHRRDGARSEERPVGNECVGTVRS